MLRPLLALFVASTVIAADAWPTAGTWIFWETTGTSLVRTKVTWKGTKVASAVGLQWANLPEPLASQIAHGKSPKTALFPHARVSGQILDVQALDDGRGRIAGRGPQAVQGEKIPPVAWEMKLVQEGLMVGSSVDAKGGESTTQVIGCREELFKPAGTLPAPGTTTEMACLDGAVPYHYSLRLPKGYDKTKPAPLLVVFSPVGDAKPLQTELLDRLGWVCAGLKESRNGPWDPITQNRDATLFDLHRRVAIDWSQVRFAGVSGGARASIMSACHHADSVAGILAIVAGTAPPWRPASTVPIFYITGKTDMNRQEILDAHAADTKAGRPTELVVHEGGHSSGGNDIEIQGLRWLAERRPGSPGGAAVKGKR